MRNPARKALYCLLLVLTSAGLIWFGAVRQEALGDDWTGVGPVLLGFALLPFPLYILVEASFAMRGRARLLAGIGVIARWHVPAADWERFRGFDSRRSGEDLKLGNDLRIRGRATSEPVEVIVGERSALVDGSYHMLSPRALPELRSVGWIEGSPVCLEFSLRYPRSRYGGPMLTTVRIPVPASARAEAGRVLAHFERLIRPAPAPPDPARAGRTRALLVLLAAAAAGAGYALMRDLSKEARELILPGLAIGALVFAIFVVFIAGSMYLFRPRR